MRKQARASGKSRKASREDGRRLPLEPLAEALRRREVILFAGGGVSQNLGLPNFSALVDHLSREMGLPEGAAVIDYPVIAEAYVHHFGRLGGLRSWMDTTWHPASMDVKTSKVHNLIVDLDFPIIYTTNYDRWLEAAFHSRGKEYRKIVTVTDLAQPPQGATEIIKFHGDFEDDASLVLTEASYFARMSFESPLDIRLRADSLARPLLFLGYSLHDMNTRYLLYRLDALWKNSAATEQRPMSYIFMSRHNMAQEIVLRSRGIEPLVWEDDDPGRATKDFLELLLKMVGESPAPERVSGRKRRSRDE